MSTTGNHANRHKGTSDAILAVSDAMDLATEATNVFVMSLVSKNGAPKARPAVHLPADGSALPQSDLHGGRAVPSRSRGAVVIRTYGTRVVERRGQLSVELSTLPA